LKASALRIRGAEDAELVPLLERALRTARNQQAHSLELRAATDLARLRMMQGRRTEALDLLLWPIQPGIRNARSQRG
jgi:hypothetical protein